MGFHNYTSRLVVEFTFTAPFSSPEKKDVSFTQNTRETSTECITLSSQRQSSFPNPYSIFGNTPSIEIRSVRPSSHPQKSLVALGLNVTQRISALSTRIVLTRVSFLSLKECLFHQRYCAQRTFQLIRPQSQQQ